MVRFLSSSSSSSSSSTAATLLAALGFAATVAHAHVGAWHEAMWCLDGSSGQKDYNSYDIVSPLYQLPFRDWWFHAFNRCNQFPPAPGKFIDLPAGGSFRIEIASNRAKTSLSYGGRDTSRWPDGAEYPDDYRNDGCIISPNLHTKDRAGAAGTAFAISYVSEMDQVTPENLVVFSVAYNTPWHREVYYQVPKGMPACPEAGCICAWGWVPDGCGQSNIYMQGFRCKVSGATSTTPVAKPKSPVWCEGDESKCVKGAKQMIYWNQLEGNNVFVEGMDGQGKPKSPGYNMKMGFRDGAQNDIFAGPASNGGGNTNNNHNNHNTNTNTITTNTKNNNGGSGIKSNSGSTTSHAAHQPAHPVPVQVNKPENPVDVSSALGLPKVAQPSENAKRPGRCAAGRSRKRRAAEAEAEASSALVEVEGREPVDVEGREATVDEMVVARGHGHHARMHAKRTF